MSDYIEDRLKMVSDLADRKLLRKILYDVYSGAAEYNMEIYENLERRIYDEIEDPLNNFYIYACLDERVNIDPIDPFLHPIIPEDIYETVYDMKEMASRLSLGGGFVIASIFMKCDSLMLQEILNADRSYKGYVKTAGDIIEVKVRVKPCEKYIREIEKLYRVFQRNGIVWNTVNCPYAYKFIDIVLNSAINLKEGDEVKEITVDLAEFDRYKEAGVIPLWNITRIDVQDKSFPLPARDRINFDHVVSLEEPGVQNGYMVDLDESEQFLYCKRYKDDLVIVSSDGSQHNWPLIRIESIENKRRKSFDYELVSNRRDLGFSGRYATARSMIVRTKGEIARILKSYEISGELYFHDLEILDIYEKKQETCDFNSFIDDNIRVDDSKKMLLLKFKPETRENYLIQDKMSFLVSEIQILFPEYKCVGELI